MDNNAVAVILQMLLCIIIIILNKKIFISGFGGLLKKAPDKFSLIALGSAACFVYSILEKSFLTTAVIITLFAIVNIITERLFAGFEDKKDPTPFSDKMKKKSEIFVYIVIAISFVTFIIWMILGADIKIALGYAATVLLSAGSFTLFISAPLSYDIAHSIAAKFNIIVNDTEVFDKADDSEKCIINKTGIITVGKPVVTDVFSSDSLTSSGYSALKVDRSEDELIRIAGIMEAQSSHPVAVAVTEYAHNRAEFEKSDVSGFIKFEGKGLEGKINDAVVRCGSHEFISNHVIIPAEIEERAGIFSTLGKTPIYYARDNKLLGIIAVQDAVNEDSAQSITELKDMGLKVLLLTRDNPKTAKAIADKVGAYEVVYGSFSGEEKEISDKYLNEENTILIGNDINEEANVIINGSVFDISAFIRLSKMTIKNIYRNIFWILLYNIIMIPVACGCFAKAFGFELSPVVGALLMCIASLIITCSILGLNRIDIYDPSRDKTLNRRRKWRKRSRSNILTISLKS